MDLDPKTITKRVYSISICLCKTKFSQLEVAYVQQIISRFPESRRKNLIESSLRDNLIFKRDLEGLMGIRVRIQLARSKKKKKRRSAKRSWLGKGKGIIRLSTRGRLKRKLY